MTKHIPVPSAKMRKKPNLKTLFAKGDESYLSVLIKLFDRDIVRIVICNDRLAENGKIWKQTAEMIQDTDLELTLGTINKEDFRVLMAVDILNSESGEQSIECVKSQNEYLNLINNVIADYHTAMDIVAENPENVPPDLAALQGIEEVGNTGVGTYTPQTDEEIQFMYQ